MDTLCDTSMDTLFYTISVQLRSGFPRDPYHPSGLVPTVFRGESRQNPYRTKETTCRIVLNFV